MYIPSVSGDSLSSDSHRQTRQPLPGRHHRHRTALLLLAGIADELHRLGLGKLERKARQGGVRLTIRQLELHWEFAEKRKRQTHFYQTKADCLLISALSAI